MDPQGRQAGGTGVSADEWDAFFASEENASAASMAARASEEEARGGGGGRGDDDANLAVTPETSPLDLARACHWIITRLYRDIRAGRLAVMDVSVLMDNLRKWMASHFHRILKPPVDTLLSLGEQIWYSLAILSKIDERRHHFLEAASRDIDEVLSKLTSKPTRRDMMNAFEKRLRGLMIHFHHVHRFKIEYDKTVKETVHSLRELAVASAAAINGGGGILAVQLEGVDGAPPPAASSSSSAAAAPPPPPPPQHPPVSVYEDETKYIRGYSADRLPHFPTVEAFVASIDPPNMEVYCMALANSIEADADRSLGFIGICTRYFNWRGVRDRLVDELPFCREWESLRLREFGVVAEEVDAMVPRFYGWLDKYKDQKLDSSYQAQYRDFMYELHMPAGAIEDYTRKFGDGRKNDKTYARFLAAFADHESDSRIFDGIAATFKSNVAIPTIKVLSAETDPKVRDFFSFFYCGRMYFHLIRRIKFFAHHVHLPDEFHGRRKEQQKMVLSEVPLKIARPLILIFGGHVIVHDMNYRIRCPTLLHSFLLWVWLVKRRYDDCVPYKDLYDVRITELSKVLLPPPREVASAAAAAPTLPPRLPLPDEVSSRMYQRVELKRARAPESESSGAKRARGGGGGGGGSGS